MLVPALVPKAIHQGFYLKTGHVHVARSQGMRAGFRRGSTSLSAAYATETTEQQVIK